MEALLIPKTEMMGSKIYLANSGDANSNLTSQINIEQRSSIAYQTWVKNSVILFHLFYSDNSPCYCLFIIIFPT